MNHLVFTVLISLALAPFTTTSLHPRMSTRQLIRLAEQRRAQAEAAKKEAEPRPAAGTAATAAEPAVEEEPVVEQPEGLPTIPEHPGDKKESWTIDQRGMWGKIEKHRIPLHSAIQPDNKDGIAEVIPAASYVDHLKRLTDVIDRDLVGTDNREVIAELPELQQLLLHTILYIPRREDHPYKNNLQVRKEIVDLLREVYSQWDKLKIHDGQLATQVLNVDEMFASWTDEPLSSTEQRLLNTVTDSLRILDSKTDDTTYSEQDLNQAAKALEKVVDTMDKNGLFARSSRARKIINDLPDDFAEGLPEDARKSLADALGQYDNFVDDVVFTRPQQERLAQMIEGLEQDIANTEEVLIEAGKIVGQLANEFYANAHQLYMPGFKSQKVLRQDFFKRSRVTMPACARAFKRFFQLAHREEVIDAVRRQDLPIIEVINLPEDFFNGAEQLPGEQRYPFAEHGTNLAMFLLTKLGKATHPEIDEIMADFDGIALATKHETAIFDNLSHAMMHLYQTIGRIDQSFTADLPEELKRLADPSTPLPLFSNLPADMQERYRFLIGQITQLIKSNAVTIGTNHRFRKLIVPPGTNSVFLRRTPDNLNEQNRKSSSVLRILLGQIVQGINKHQLKNIETSYQWKTDESNVKALITPLDALLYEEGTAEPRQLSTDPFKRNSKTEELIAHLERLAEMVTRPAEQDKRDTIRETGTLRDAIERTLLLPDEFWRLANNYLSTGERYAVAAAGSKLYTALNKSLDPASPFHLGFKTEDGPRFDLFAQKFNDLALSNGDDEGDTERKNYTTLKKTVDEMSDLTKQLDELNAVGGAADLATDVVPEARDEVLSKYTRALLRFKNILSNGADRIGARSRRIMLGTNHMMRGLLFNDQNEFFINDVPEGLDESARDAMKDVLKSVRDNPSNFGYEDSAAKESVKYQLNRLLDDLKKDDRDAVQKMPKEAKHLYRRLFVMLKDLGKKETYAVGARAIALEFAGDRNEKKRELVGKHDPLYTLMFSSQGIPQLPQGISIVNPFAPDSGFDVQSGLAGFTLYDLILNNKKEFGITKRDDDYTLKWLQRAHASFQAITNPNFKRVVQRENSSLTDDAGKKVTAQQAQDEALSTSNEGFGREASPTNETDIDTVQELMERVSDLSEQLKNPDTFQDAAAGFLATLEDNGQREEFGKFPEVARMLVSKQGILIGVAEVPKSLSIAALTIGIRMYTELRKHPNDLGWKGKRKLIKPRINGMIKALERRKKELETKKRQKELSNMHDDDVTAFGANVTAKQALGPMPDMSKMNARQQQVVKLLYRIYDDLRSRTIIRVDKAITELLAITQNINRNDAIFKWMAYKQKLQLWRLIAHPELSKRFHSTVMIDFIPDDSAKPEFAKHRQRIIQFYETMVAEETDYDLDAVNEQRAKNIIGWFKDPANAPKRSHYMTDELFDEAGSSNNPWAQQMAMHASLNGRSGKGVTSQLAMANSGVMPYGMPGMHGMHGSYKTPGMYGFASGGFGQGGFGFGGGFGNGMYGGQFGMNPYGSYKHSKGGSSGYMQNELQELKMKQMLQERQEIDKLKQEIADLRSGKKEATDDRTIDSVTKELENKEAEVKEKDDEFEQEEHVINLRERRERQERLLDTLKPQHKTISKKAGESKKRKERNKLRAKRDRLASLITKAEEDIASIDEQLLELRIVFAEHGKLPTPEERADKADADELEDDESGESASPQEKQQAEALSANRSLISQELDSLNQQLQATREPRERFEIRYRAERARIDREEEVAKQALLSSQRRLKTLEKERDKLKGDSVGGKVAFQLNKLTWNSRSRAKNKQISEERKRIRKLRRQISQDKTRKLRKLDKEHDNIRALSIDRMAALDAIMSMTTLAQLNAKEAEIKSGESKLKRALWPNSERSFVLSQIEKRRKQIKNQERLGITSQQLSFKKGQEQAQNDDKNGGQPIFHDDIKDTDWQRGYNQYWDDKGFFSRTTRRERALKAQTSDPSTSSSSSNRSIAQSLSRRNAQRKANKELALEQGAQDRSVRDMLTHNQAAIRIQSLARGRRDRARFASIKAAQRHGEDYSQWQASKKRQAREQELMGQEDDRSQQDENHIKQQVAREQRQRNAIRQYDRMTAQLDQAHARRPRSAPPLRRSASMGHRIGRQSSDFADGYGSAAVAYTPPPSRASRRADSLSQYTQEDGEWDLESWQDDLPSRKPSRGAIPAKRFQSLGKPGGYAFGPNREYYDHGQGQYRHQQDRYTDPGRSQGVSIFVN